MDATVECYVSRVSVENSMCVAERLIQMTMTVGHVYTCYNTPSDSAHYHTPSNSAHCIMPSNSAHCTMPSNSAHYNTPSNNASYNMPGNNAHYSRALQCAKL